MSADGPHSSFQPWDPLFAERFDEPIDDTEVDEPEPETMHVSRTRKTSRSHDGLCRRGHAGHR